MDYAKIVNTDVCELWAAGNLSDRPNAGRRRLQSLAGFDVSVVGQFDVGQLQPKRLGVRSTAECDQHVTASQGFFCSILLDDDTDRVSRFPRYPLNPCIQKNVDALIFKQAA